MSKTVAKAAILLVLFFLMLFEEHSVIAVEEDVQDNQRQNVGCIEAHPFREAYTLTCINLFNEFVPAPAVAGSAEGQEDKAAQRQDVVADEEVFQIQHAGAFAQRLKAAPDIEAENAGQGQQNHADNSKGDEATAVTAGQLADAGNNHFEYSNNSGHCRKEHEEEEESAPDTSAVHSVENVGQSDEEQVRACIRLDTEAEACREDNQTGNDCYEGIEEHNPQRFVGELLLLADVAAEDGQRAHADAQCEEGLAHSGEDYLAYTVLGNFVEVGVEVILEAGFTARKQHGVGCKHNHQHDEEGHHNLGDAFNAVANAQVADAEAEHDDDCHVAGHSCRVLQQSTKNAFDALSVKTGKITDSHFVEEIEHPAADGGVEHHQDDVAGNSYIFEQMPFSSLRLQCVEGFGRTASAGAADGEFRYHDGQAQQQQEAQVDEHKGCTAILACDERKAPDVA